VGGALAVAVPEAVRETPVGNAEADGDCEVERLFVELTVGERLAGPVREPVELTVGERDWAGDRVVKGLADEERDGGTEFEERGDPDGEGEPVVERDTVMVAVARVEAVGLALVDRV
jgi:hypothetical protein